LLGRRDFFGGCQWPHSFCSCWRSPAQPWWPTWPGENPTAGQLTVFHHTISGYPEGWLLAIAAGLGFVAALLLVTSSPEAPAVAVSVEVGGGTQLRGDVGRMRA
jgi:hypothetical protein